MTTLVSAFILDTGPPSAGILLNPCSNSSPSNPSKAQYSSVLAASSSSSSVAPSESHSRSRSSTFGDATARKIRFAPLPEPRRDEYPSVFDRDESESDSPAQLPRHSSTPPEFAPVPPSPAHSAHSLQDTVQQLDDLTNRGKLKSIKWSHKLLRPLLQPLLPSSNSKVNEEMPRASPQHHPKHFSTNNIDNADEFKGGMPLGRRMSANVITTSKETERVRAFRDGVPLTPVWSEGGGSSSKGRKDGQRLLNGRVYGKRPLSADLEKRRQASPDPEFVEWGYGGMGSVSNDHLRSRGNATGPDWAKVQSRARTFVQAEDGDGEGDDGSGMGWVRRRREQREREKREKEERERMQKEDGVPEIEVQPPQSKAVEETHIPARKNELECDIHPKDGEQYICRAVSVPAPHHHLSRHHSSIRTSTPTSGRSLSRTNSGGSVPTQKDVISDPGHNTVNGASNGSGSSVNSLASKSSSESLNDDESEDEDDSGVEESRITSKSAGVEKISRHKD